MGYVSAGVVTVAEAVEMNNSIVTAANASRRAANARASTQLGALMGAGIGSRSDTALGYTAPKMGDFTFSVGLVNDKLQDKNADGDTVAQTKVNGQLFSVAYASGPLSGRLTTGTGKVRTQSAAVTANNFRGATAAIDESAAKVSDTALLVSYNFGVAQSYFMTESTKGTLQQFRGVDYDGTSQKTRASEIGIKVPMGAMTPYVTMSRGKLLAYADGDATRNTKTSAWQVGSTYDFSKRTQAYFGYGAMKVTSGDQDLSEKSSKSKGYAAGLVHYF